MTSQPTTNGVNGNGGGRGANGRFLVGNPGGPGSPYVKKVAALRSALFAAVSARDLRAIIKKMVEEAKAGDVAAARLLLDRLLGPCLEMDLIERLENLEQHFGVRK